MQPLDPDARLPDLEPWGASSFSSDQAFTVPLPAALAEALATAVDAVRRSDWNGSLDAIDRSSFPLQGWSDLVHRVRAQLGTGRGFVRLRGLPVDRWDAAAARLAAWGIGLCFGEHVSQTVDGQRLCDVTDTTRGDPSARQYNTSRELSLHTDPVSDLIGLACFRPAAQGGDTVLASARRIRDTLAVERPEVLDILARGFLVHRYGEGLAEDGPWTAYRVPMLVELGGRVLCRYVRPTIIAAHREAGCALTPPELDALDAFDAVARRPENHARFRLEAGDLLLVNNLGVLHSRTAFVDPPHTASPRLLFRLWLQAPDGFRAVPAEMNYFNRGRCGMPVQPGRKAEFDLSLIAEDRARTAFPGSRDHHPV